MSILYNPVINNLIQGKYPAICMRIFELWLSVADTSRIEGQDDKNLIFIVLQFVCSVIEHPYPTSHGYPAPQGPLMKAGFDLLYAITRKFKKELEGLCAQNLLEWLLKIIKDSSVETFLKKNDSRAVKIYTTIGAFMCMYVMNMFMKILIRRYIYVYVNEHIC